MKIFKLIFGLAVLTVFSITTNAQSTNAILSKTKVINASADEVWERLRNLDKIEELAPDFVGDSWVDGELGVGAKRSCAAPGQTKATAEAPAYTETVLEYDDDKRFYSYMVFGVPAKNMINSFKVVDLGYQKCMVVWTSEGWTFMENPQMNEEQFLAFVGAASDQIMNRLFELHNSKS